ncbi:hypothetical protein NVP1094O_48 [Vibrio phage 1.094.O._10N.286.55.E12]|nr:hypothetical protein NVP1094O_48 [Vibrio phage 1.094.O._10N.286.55.E12]
MSYGPNQMYPGATELDPNYPKDKFKDNNPSTTNNGTPLKAIKENQDLTLETAVMNDAGFEYNGLPDTPQDSQLFKAYKASIGNGANLLSNHNFLVQTPDDSQPLPSATPTSYPPGYQIFSGVFANETTGITNLTYIDGRVSFSGGDLYFAVPNAGGVERLTEFAASVADFDGKPRTRGVSFALVGDEYRVTVGIDALEDVSANPTPIGSVKFEQGSVATGHDVCMSINEVFKQSKNYYIDVSNYPDVKGDLSVDCSAGFKAAYDHAVSLGFDLFIPATYMGGYFIKDIEMAGVASGYSKGIKVFGGGIVNSLGAVATVVHPKENSAFISREIGDSFDNLCFRNWTGKAGVTIQSVDIPGRSLVLATNPWELSGGAPITWDHTITSTDGTTYSNFLQFAAYGSWVSDTVVVNGDGTVTISNIKGSNGTLDSDFLSGLATSIERFSSYAHFETVPIDGLLNELGSIHLDIAENSIFNKLWFTQVRKAFSHDLGSGAGPNVNIGKLGLYSNIIVDGANDFMTGVDLRGSSQESLHGGQFSNVQFFSCRRAFNGRRLENLTFASCVFNYSQTLFRATDAYNLQWTGGEIGWGTGTGNIENVVEIPGQCFGLNINGAKWGRHATGNVLKLGQVRDLNLSGNNHQSISESNVVGNEFLVVTDFINSSYIGGNSISNEFPSSDYMTADFTALNALSKISDTNFAQPIQAFGASDVIADLSSGTSVYQFMYSLAKFKDGGSAAFEDVNSGYVSVSNKNIHKYGGTLNPSVVFTMPNFNATPNSAEQIILDFSAVNFNGQFIAVNSSGGSAITTVSAQGVVTLTKLANSFIATT